MNQDTIKDITMIIRVLRSHYRIQNRHEYVDMTHYIYEANLRLAELLNIPLNLEDGKQISLSDLEHVIRSYNGNDIYRDPKFCISEFYRFYF
jgi:hypothetical protein